MTDHDATPAADIDAIRARADAATRSTPADPRSPLMHAVRALAAVGFKDYAAAVEPLIADIPALLADRDALAAEVERLSGPDVVLLEEHAALTAELAAARARVADLEAENTNLRGELEILYPANAERLNEVATLRAELAVERTRVQLNADVIAELRLVCSGCGHSRNEHLADGCDAGGPVLGGDCPCPGAVDAPPAAPVRITPPDERHPTSGLIGLFTTGHTDLGRRSEEIIRGEEEA